jgi:rSAM/selenodomain-associated transferase 2/rSAM/selenodomain-associated transferase 1
MAPKCEVTRREELRMLCHQDPNTKERLAVFARFPEPGRTKTRLIPTLGPKSAAQLHAEMVRHTLRRVDELDGRHRVSLEVWFAGGDAERFRAAFGERCYRRQAEGDLGARMAHAFGAMLVDARAAVIIGTDCPGITARIVSDAFEGLRDHDLVLGPATDGGYYLIGLRRHVPDLFHRMPWGTAQVLSETLARADQLGLGVHLLPPLDDVDEPNDLAAWEAARSRVEEPSRGEKAGVSIIIPTLNEAALIGRTIRAALRPGVDVIVADGGSTDGTREIAAASGTLVIDAPPGRGSQLNAGAARARGSVLLFLHADTFLPSDYLDAVCRAMADPRVIVGAFRLRIDRCGLLLRLVETGVRIRCALFRTPYGDQALFLRAGSFRQLGGFADIPLMEDADLVDRAGAVGEIRIVRDAVITSGRRWESAGVLRMTLINLACLVGFRLGVSPARLAAWRDRLSRFRVRQPEHHSHESTHRQEEAK